MMWKDRMKWLSLLPPFLLLCYLNLQCMFNFKIPGSYKHFEVGKVKVIVVGGPLDTAEII